MRLRKALALSCILALVPLAVGAQAPRGGEAVTARFEAAASDIGEPLPELTVHDRDGNPLALRELLQGHYTVIVLGCLT